MNNFLPVASTTRVVLLVLCLQGVPHTQVCGEQREPPQRQRLHRTFPRMAMASLKASTPNAQNTSPLRGKTSPCCASTPYTRRPTHARHVNWWCGMVWCGMGPDAHTHTHARRWIHTAHVVIGTPTWKASSAAAYSPRSTRASPVLTRASRSSLVFPWLCVCVPRCVNVKTGVVAAKPLPWRCAHRDDDEVK